MRTYLLLTKELLQIMNAVFSKHLNTLLGFKTLKILLAVLAQLTSTADEMKTQFHF